MRGARDRQPEREREQPGQRVDRRQQFPGSRRWHPCCCRRWVRERHCDAATDRVLSHSFSPSLSRGRTRLSGCRISHILAKSRAGVGSRREREERLGVFPSDPQHLISHLSLSRTCIRLSLPLLSPPASALPSCSPPDLSTSLSIIVVVIGSREHLTATAILSLSLSSFSDWILMTRTRNTTPDLLSVSVYLQ